MALKDCGTTPHQATLLRWMVAAACWSLPLLGHAVDGVIEINQARALAGGVTAGDTAGFPVTIDAPGSYALTSSLTVTDANADGIEVTANGVTLDLNGFEVAGPVVCTGTGSFVVCGAGTGRGIDAGGRERFAVENGSVRGFGDDGVSTSGARIRSIAAHANGGTGISAGGYGIVTDSIGRANFGHGISAANGSIVQRSVGAENRETGIQAGPTASILDCAGSKNGNYGIHAVNGSIVRNSVAYFNALSGVRCGFGGLVSDTSAYINDRDGIEALSGCTVQRSSSFQNDWFGLRLEPAASYRENSIGNNVLGTVTETGVNLGDNVCNGVASCP